MTDLGGNDNIAAMCAEGAPDELLRDTVVVGVGGVDEADAEVKGAPEDRSSVGRVADSAAEGIGAESDDGDSKPGGPKQSVFHVAGPSRDDSSPREGPATWNTDCLGPPG